MPAERAGYTVTMFLIDVSPSMGKPRTVEVPDGPNGEMKQITMSNLEWSLQYVLLKIQEMIFNGRKTDQCGVLLFGTEDTKNIVNTKHSDDYLHVTEYISIAQPNAGTLAKIQALQPSEVIGDPVDAIIVGIETQNTYLGNKKSWTRKMVLLTDGENPIEVQDWELTVSKVNELEISLTMVGIDFDDDEFGFVEEDKSQIKQKNEEFFHEFMASVKNGVIGTAAFALQECARPEVKMTKSVLMGTTLRLGDVSTRPEEAVEIPVKMSKLTAVARPPSMKKFAKRSFTVDDDAVDEEEGTKDTFVQLGMQTEYTVKHNEKEKEDEDEDEEKKETDEDTGEKVDKEQLIRGFKYGASYAPCPDGHFESLSTKKGVDICGFFPEENIRREYGMGEVQFVWADPSTAYSQIAFSSIVRAMREGKVVAIARLVTRDGMDPKMGLLIPQDQEGVDCFLWLQMPFADDVRKYAFPALENLVSKKGEPISKHPFLPTEDQLEAMDDFVDQMDLMNEGEKDEEGNRWPWFNPSVSYNPAIHRIKQALFHAAVVTDLKTNPLPPPHPEITTYLEPPKRMLKRARTAIENCKSAFDVKQVPKRIARQRKDGHNIAKDDDDDEPLLLDQPKKPERTQTTLVGSSAAKDELVKLASPEFDVDTKVESDDKAAPADSDTEPESDEDVDMKAEPGSTIEESQNFESQGSMLESQELSQGIVVNDKPPGRLIGFNEPQSDFESCTRNETKVVKAVEDLFFIVDSVVHRPFASKRFGEMVDCLKVARATCIKSGNIDQWNSLLSDLKLACTGADAGGSRSFWKTLGSNSTLSLIGKSEASTSGGKSRISDELVSSFFGD